MIKEIFDIAIDLRSWGEGKNIKTLASLTTKICKEKGMDNVDYWFVLGLLKSGIPGDENSHSGIPDAIQSQTAHTTIFS